MAPKQRLANYQIGQSVDVLCSDGYWRRGRVTRKTDRGVHVLRGITVYVIDRARDICPARAESVREGR